jgi:hypothetical protein
MMPIENLLQRILRDPTPDDLWALHPYLLALDVPEAAPARDLARLFFCYLSCVRGKLTSKQHSSLSALLAAGSVGMVVAQDIWASLQEGGAQTISELLAGSVAGVLETASAYQHVRAWDTEFQAVHDEALWHLYAALWQISVETQPDLPTGKRQALVDNLMSALRQPDLDGGVRIALVIRLLQILLAVRLVPLAALIKPQPAAVSEQGA